MVADMTNYEPGSGPEQKVQPGAKGKARLSIQRCLVQFLVFSL